MILEICNMLLKNYKSAIPYLLKANIPSLAWGRHAAGKTSIPAQVAEEHGHGIFNLRVGNMADAGDLLGLADFVTNKAGERVATRFFMPDWLKAANDFCEKNPDKYYIIHWDEVNRARKDLRVPLFQILLDKRLHTYEIHPNVRHLASANPNTEDYTDVQDMSDKAFNSRWLHLKITPHYSEWLDYAVSQGCDSTILDFIKEQPKMLHKEGADFSLDFVEPDERNWLNLDKLIKIDTPADLLQDLGAGLVGLPAMISFLEARQSSDRPFTAEEILTQYKKIKDKVKKLSDSNGATRTDLLKIACDNLVQALKVRQGEQKSLTAKENKNLAEFLLDIPLGISFAACQDLFTFEIFRPMFTNNTELQNKIRAARNIK